MILLLLSIAWAVLVGVMIRRAVVQFQSYESIDGMEDSVPSSLVEAPPVTIIIPARNEAGRIGRCVQGVQMQDYPAESLEAIVIDDGSTDGTADEARSAARGDSRIQIVASRPLPRGWTGKSHACWQGAERAKGQWLLFLDADTVPQPSLVRSAVAAAKARGISFLSLEPFQELKSFSERLIMPAGFYLVAVTQDLRRINDSNRPDATANGQCLLVRAAEYKRLGGHAAVCDEIAEDKALAVRFKRSGYSIAILGAERLISTRMYTRLPELWEGLSKNLCDRFGGAKGTLLAGTAAVALAAISIAMPWASAANAIRDIGPWTIAAVIASWGASFSLLLVHVGTARHLRIPWWYGALFPLAYVADGALAFYAVWKQARGNVTWKGRVVSPEAVAGAVADQSNLDNQIEADRGETRATETRLSLRNGGVLQD
jgi:chlorobactene glucosyltransferase